MSSMSSLIDTFIEYWSATTISATRLTTHQQSQQSSQQSAPQQLSTIEKSVTHLLVATKQLLETLTQWSRGSATEGQVSDVYVRLGYEFNIACRAFNSISVDTTDLGPVPDLLRSILEETLSQEASQASLDRFLPRIRDIIINLLHGLKKKQQRLRQRTTSAGSQTSRQVSLNSNASMADSTLVVSDENMARHPSSRSYTSRAVSGDDATAPYPARAANGESTTSPYPGRAANGDNTPPRSASAHQRRHTSPRKESLSRGREAIRDANNSDYTAVRDANSSDYATASETSSLSSEAMQNLPVISPYSQQNNTPPQPTPPPHRINPDPTLYISAPSPPLPLEDTSNPPPPPPKQQQQDALAALQRGGDLERRASRRFSAYQISKHLGSTNGIPMMIPAAQTSPIPNRGRDTRESLNAVRTRSILQHGRKQSSRLNPSIDTTPKKESTSHLRATEDPKDGQPSDTESDLSPFVKTPEDKLGHYPFPSTGARTATEMSATSNGPLVDPPLSEDQAFPQSNGISRRNATASGIPATTLPIQQSTSQPQFVPEASPQPGKELTLFLQYKSKIKKFVLPDGADLSIPRLQLAFIEKFAWNTHSNGVDLPEIYLQDSVSGVRHELEDLNDIKDRAVLVLNIEQLDEVKRHFDHGLGDLRQLIEGLKSSVVDQQTAIQRVSDKQQESAIELASIAATPRAGTVTRMASGARGAPGPKLAASQLDEVQSLRRDLAVVRQTYTSFVDDINASMANIRTKATSVKQAAVKASVPSMNIDAGRAYVNAGKDNLETDSQKLVDRVDDLQDIVEDLRKDVVTRGVRPLPHQLDMVSKDISGATMLLRKMQEYLKREKPVWTKIWEKELQLVCDDRELFTMQEELCADLEDDLAKAAATYALVEEATRQQNAQVAPNGAPRQTSRTLMPLALDQGADPHKAKDGVLGEVRALQPNHESRLEAIERAEKLRKKELESRRPGEFQKELGSFVEEGKLKKTGGVDEIERQRKLKDERTQREVWERQQAREAERAAKAAERARQEAAAKAAESATADTGPESIQSAPEEGSSISPPNGVASESAAVAPLGTTASHIAEDETTPASDDMTSKENNGSHDSKLEVPVPSGDLGLDHLLGGASPGEEFVEARENVSTPGGE